MYTPTITKKSFDRTLRQVILTVDFNDGTNTVTDTLNFGADIPLNQIYRSLKTRASLLDQVEAKEALIQTGVVDIASLADDDRTASEIASDEWLRDFERLQNAQILLDMNILTASTDEFVSLKNKVKTNFKPEYINLF